MPALQTQSGPSADQEEVLTLAEAAAYLRVAEQALADLAAEHAVPGQQIGGEWRFLKRALNDWLRYGPRFSREMRMLPGPWMFDYPPLEELLQILEGRLLDRVGRLAQSSPRPGSKQAVLKHFGVFQDDKDLEERLADVRSRREASGGG